MADDDGGLENQSGPETKKIQERCVEGKEKGILDKKRTQKEEDNGIIIFVQYQADLNMA